MNHAPAQPVLLVEDDLDLAGNIQDYLEHHGWLVDHAPNGALGLHRLLAERHSVAILDLRLPGLGGLELCQRMRAQTGTALPVLMLTAADTLKDRLTGFEAGADDYMVKPFALPELLARLQVSSGDPNPIWRRHQRHCTSPIWSSIRRCARFAGLANCCRSRTWGSPSWRSC
jgi:DNA-binding response OmpR family regulator